MTPAGLNHYIVAAGLGLFFCWVLFMFGYFLWCALQGWLKS